jgi:hypothetical protein
MDTALGALRANLSGLSLGDSNRRTVMSLTKLAVEEAKINQRIEAARRAGDLAEMQRCMGELTALRRSYYGHPQVQPSTVADERG